MKPVSLPPALELLRASARPAAEAGQGVPAESWQREMEKAQVSMWLGHEPVGTFARNPAGARQDAEPRSDAQPVQPQEKLTRTRSAQPGGAAGRAGGAGRGEPAAPIAPRIRLSPGLFAATSQSAFASAETVAATAGPHSDALVLNTVGAIVSRAVPAPVEISAGAEPPSHPAMPVGMASSRPLPARAGEAAPAAAAGKTPFAIPRDEADPEAVRVYCQFTAEGVMVWIGAAAGSGLNAQAVATQLQQALARQSQRLACFTCNGSAVALEPEPFLSTHHKEPTWPLEQ